MAIIVCPECGGKVSDKATACVHCGCNFFVCPECGKVYLENVEVCSECGYQMKVDATEKNFKKEQDTDIKAITKRWSAQSITHTVSQKRYRYLLNAGIVLMLVLLWLCFSDWLSGDMVTDYQSTLSSIRTYVVLVVVLCILSKAHEFLMPLLAELDLQRWSRTQQINLKQSLREAYTADFSKRSVEENVELSAVLDRASWAAVYSEDFLVASKHKTEGVIKVVLYAVGAILAAIFAINNLQIIMQATLWASDLLGIEGFNLSMIENWWLLVVSVAIWIAIDVYEKKMDASHKVVRNAWMKGNLPECFGNHDKYVNKVADYIASNGK